MPKDTTAPFWKHCSSSPTFEQMKPIQQEICSKSWTTTPWFLAHDPAHGLRNRGTGFFCMLGLYKRQSRAEARRGNRRTNRTGGRTEKTEGKNGEKTEGKNRGNWEAEQGGIGLKRGGRLKKSKNVSDDTNLGFDGLTWFDKLFFHLV